MPRSAYSQVFTAHHSQPSVPPTCSPSCILDSANGPLSPHHPDQKYRHHIGLLPSPITPTPKQSASPVNSTWIPSPPLLHFSCLSLATSFTEHVCQALCQHSGKTEIKRLAVWWRETQTVSAEREVGAGGSEGCRRQSPTPQQ